MSKNSNGRALDTSLYDAYVNSRHSIFDDELPSSTIRQRISESSYDDTHPSTDSELDSQEIYNMG